MQRLGEGEQAVAEAAQDTRGPEGPGTSAAGEGGPATDVGHGGEGAPECRGAEGAAGADQGEVVGAEVPRAFVDRVTTVAGTEVVLRRPVPLDNSVRHFRLQVAAVMGVGLKQLRILVDGADLEDRQMLSTALEGFTAGHPTVVVLSPEVCLGDLLPGIPSGQRIRPEMEGKRAWVNLGTVEFPPPTGININMMPFRAGDKQSLPQEYWPYWPIIAQCSEESCRRTTGWGRPPAPRFQGGPEDVAPVFYLTIHESFTARGCAQRRPGVHIEAPGVALQHGGDWEIDWGGWGSSTETFHGGLYMASNVANSCRIWDILVQNYTEVVGPRGSLEHVRDVMPPGKALEAGQLVWLTDKTPHESVPLEGDADRQFLRVVTSTVGIWYEKHSTKNPLGTVPDPKITRVVRHDKFEGGTEVQGSD